MLLRVLSSAKYCVRQRDCETIVAVNDRCDGAEREFGYATAEKHGWQNDTATTRERSSVVSRWNQKSVSVSEKHAELSLVPLVLPCRLRRRCNLRGLPPKSGSCWSAAFSAFHSRLRTSWSSKRSLHDHSPERTEYNEKLESKFRKLFKAPTHPQAPSQS